MTNGQHIAAGGELLHPITEQCANVVLVAPQRRRLDAGRATAGVTADDPAAVLQWRVVDRRRDHSRGAARCTDATAARRSTGSAQPTRDLLRFLGGRTSSEQ